MSYIIKYNIIIVLYNWIPPPPPGGGAPGPVPGPGHVVSGGGHGAPEDALRAAASPRHRTRPRAVPGGCITREPHFGKEGHVHQNWSAATATATATTATAVDERHLSVSGQRPSRKRDGLKIPVFEPVLTRLRARSG